MKKRIKQFIYDTLLKWRWIEQPEKAEFEKLIESFGFKCIFVTWGMQCWIDDNAGLKDSVMIYDLKTEIHLYQIPYKENPYLTALAYFAYFGIREKQGEGFKETGIRKFPEPLCEKVDNKKVKEIMQRIKKGEEDALQKVMGSYERYSDSKVVDIENKKPNDN